MSCTCLDGFSLPHSLTIRSNRPIEQKHFAELTKASAEQLGAKREEEEEEKEEEGEGEKGGMLKEQEKEKNANNVAVYLRVLG